MSLISSEFNAISHAFMSMMMVSPLRHSSVTREGRDRVKRHTSSPKRLQDQTSRPATDGVGLNVAERCRTRLSPELQKLLDTAARRADEAGVLGYAVGGF